MSIIAYLNGEFLPLDQAKISVMDRGFLFGDGVYEVISVYDGHMFKLKEHLQRLQNSLDAIALKIDFDEQHWTKLLKNLCERNPAKNHYIYLQITRGAYPERLHGFPEETKPTVFAFAREVQDLDMKKLSAGLSAITLNDERGYQCHIKSTSLLANVLLKQQAIDNQATEAILIRDDQAIEGASSNFFIVKDNFLITPPQTIHHIIRHHPRRHFRISPTMRFNHRTTPYFQSRIIHRRGIMDHQFHPRNRPHHTM